jgi:hypothetical protein
MLDKDCWEPLMFSSLRPRVLTSTDLSASLPSDAYSEFRGQ